MCSSDLKYGTGGTQALGQLNSMDETGYAGTQSVAKEFGLSDNNPLVRKWDQDNTMDSLDESPMLDPQGHSVHTRAAAIVSDVFGEPPAPAPQALAGGAVEISDPFKAELRKRLLCKLLNEQNQSSVSSAAAQSVMT